MCLNFFHCKRSNDNHLLNYKNRYLNILYPIHAAYIIVVEYKNDLRIAIQSSMNKLKEKLSKISHKITLSEKICWNR